MDGVALVNFLLPYGFVAALAAVWSASEIVQTFRGDVRRALFNGWAVLLLVGNAAFSIFVFVLLRWVFPTTRDFWPLGLAAGIGGQALLRAQLNLLQPLDLESSRTVTVSLADLYGRFQQFCREEIDRVLVEERMRLLDKAITLPAEELEHQVRLRGYSSALHNPDEVESYLKRLGTLDDQKRQLLLASYLLREGGFGFLSRLCAKPARKRVALRKEPLG